MSIPQGGTEAVYHFTATKALPWIISSGELRLAAKRDYTPTRLNGHGGCRRANARAPSRNATDEFYSLGGMSLGLEQAGFTPAGLVEIDPDACSTPRNNQPHWHVIEGDINIFGAGAADERSRITLSLKGNSRDQDAVKAVKLEKIKERRFRLSSLIGHIFQEARIPGNRTTREKCLS